MTVSTDTTKSATVVGNGVATVFPFTFKIFQTSDVSVVLAVVATGVETVLTEGVDYSVSMNADQEADPGGEVTYPLSGSPMASTHSLTLVRDVPYTQGLDLTLGGSFNPDSIEKALDRVTTLVQQLKEAVGRAVKVSISSGLTPDEFFLDNITNAEANANAAAASAAEAATSESNAAGSEAAARASLEDFLSRYVGAAASDPVVDGNGDALTDGDLYWNTTVPEFRVYSSGTWITFLDPGVLTVTPFAETLLAAADLAAAQSVLEIPSVLEIQNLIDAARRVTFAGIISSSGPSEATKYYHPNGNVSDVHTSPNVVAAPSPTDFTLTSLRTRLATNTFDGALALTVMVNGVATAATVTYAAGETGAKSWSGSVAISAGDAIEVRFAESATTGNIAQLAWAMS